MKAAAKELAPVLGWSVSDTEEALTGDAGFSYLRKNVEPRRARRRHRPGIPGIGADPVAERIYPAGSVAGNVLGFVGDGGEALAGTELSSTTSWPAPTARPPYERGAQGQIIPTGAGDHPGRRRQRRSSP